MARVSIIRLEPIVAQKREELKEEMIGKLVLYILHMFVEDYLGFKATFMNI